VIERSVENLLYIYCIGRESVNVARTDLFRNSFRSKDEGLTIYKDYTLILENLEEEKERQSEIERQRDRKREREKERQCTDR